ncbi:MAG: sugar transferase [Bacteroidota bacterium]|nr:sugar transferase [Bacteroidota bacterium]
MLKRIFDILFSFLGLIIFSPVFLIIAVLIFFEKDSKRTIFFKQLRVGKNNVDFTLFKFKTMKVNSEKKGLLTVGDRDKRITSAGYYLRKYKLDELPQLVNVLLGDMSFVGPRPEVRKYVELYNDDQKRILEVRPGITDVASIKYSKENELLAKSENPENYYVKEIMPDKIRLNLLYLSDRSFFKDIQIIFNTIKKIIY